MGSPAALESPFARPSALERGRASIQAQAWNTAFTALSEADRQASLGAEDLELLSAAAHLTGRDAEAADILARVHQAYLAQQNPQKAARCAAWVSLTCLFKGDLAQSSGWLSRAQRLLEDQPECVERGYVLLPLGVRSVREGDFDSAHAAFVEATRLGQRFGDRDLTSFALHGQGRALIRQGETARGVALLDEAMVAITAGEVSPMIAGGIYCSVIEACSEIFDLRRAQEWTAALERWCNSQPDLVPYRGHCLIRRAEISQMHGKWPDALNQAQSACEHLSLPPPKPAVGAAFYCKAEMHRLRGEFEQAELAYREATRWERTPRPGLAQLRLAQGQVAAAYAAIQHAAEEVEEPSPRSQILDAYVEIALASGDVNGARAASEELSEIAARLKAELLHSQAARAQGAVLLAEQESKAAIAKLRRALSSFLQLETPYEAAKTQVLLGRAYREQGNRDSAESEWHGAREIFRKLGAAPDLARLEAFIQKKQDKTNGLLTTREVEVIQLIASGSTNREIAGRLKISEKTVARHVSNIFNKLDISSRAAATAYAYQHGLVRPART
jgi:ATP/maltotriose-dependent transcriptional regulator MalT